MSVHEVRKYGVQIDPDNFITDELLEDIGVPGLVEWLVTLHAKVKAYEGCARAGVLVDVDTMHTAIHTSPLDGQRLMFTSVRGAQYAPYTAKDAL